MLLVGCAVYQLPAVVLLMLPLLFIGSRFTAISLYEEISGVQLKRSAAACIQQRRMKRLADSLADRCMMNADVWATSPAKQLVKGCIRFQASTVFTPWRSAALLVLVVGSAVTGQNPMTGPNCIVRVGPLSAARLPSIVIEGLPAMPSSLKWHSSRP
jgi:hypothetical protein